MSNIVPADFESSQFVVTMPGGKFCPSHLTLNRKLMPSFGSHKLNRVASQYVYLYYLIFIKKLARAAHIESFMRLVLLEVKCFVFVCLFYVKNGPFFGGSLGLNFMKDKSFCYLFQRLNGRVS